MPRKIILDANIINDINRGNKEAADALKTMLNNGDRVWIAHRAHFEATGKNTDPVKNKANSLILQELRIPLAPKGTMKDRTDLYFRNIGVPSESDVLVAAQAKVNDAEVWSFNGPFINNHVQLTNDTGLKVAPESYNIPFIGKKGQFNYKVGRKLLGLPPVKISPTGQATAMSLKWICHGTRENELPIVHRLTSNGESIPVTDLDPVMPGGVVVAMIFPATDWAVDLFERTPPVKDNLALLGTTPNVRLIRFIEPANVNLVKRREPEETAA